MKVPEDAASGVPFRDQVATPPPKVSHFLFGVNAMAV
jgi:hypothetical protein